MRSRRMPWRSRGRSTSVGPSARSSAVQVVVAARHAEQQLGLAAHGLGDGVVGRGVAGVQSEHDVGLRVSAADAAAREAERLRAEPLRRSTLLRITSSFTSTPSDVGGDCEHVVEVMVHRECQVTRPAAAIEDLHGRGRGSASRHRRGREGVA